MNCAWPPPTGGHDDQGRPVFLGSDSPQRAAPEGRQGPGRSGWPAARSSMVLLATWPARGCVTGPHRPRGLICTFQSTPQDAPCGSDDALGAVTWGPLGDEESDPDLSPLSLFLTPRSPRHVACESDTGRVITTRDLRVQQGQGAGCQSLCELAGPASSGRPRLLKLLRLIPESPALARERATEGEGHRSTRVGVRPQAGSAARAAAWDCSPGRQGRGSALGANSLALRPRAPPQRIPGRRRAVH